MTSRSDFRQKLAERNAEIVRLRDLDVKLSDIARVLSVSTSTVRLVLEEHRRQADVDVPVWVPERLREDYETIARESDEESAAAYCRRAKREAVLHAGPCEYGVH